MAERTVAVVSDSSGGLDPVVAAHFGVCVVPVRVIVGERTLADGAVAPGQIQDALSSGAAVRAEAPHRLAFLTAFKDAEEAGATAIVAVVSGAPFADVAAAAESAAEDAPIPVTVVDAGAFSLSLGLAALAAGAVSLEGGDSHAVADAARDTAASARQWFTVDTLKPLRTSGRAPALISALGKLNKAKPIVAAAGGDLTEADRVGGTTTARRAIIDLVERAATDLDQAVAALGLAQGDPAAKGLEITLDGPVLSAPPPASIAVTLGSTLFHAAVADMPDEFFTVYEELAAGAQEGEGSLALAS